MGNVVSIATGLAGQRKLGRREQDAAAMLGQPCEILFFTGVRYERHDVTVGKASLVMAPAARRRVR